MMGPNTAREKNELPLLKLRHWQQTRPWHQSIEVTLTGVVSSAIFTNEIWPESREKGSAAREKSARMENSSMASGKNIARKIWRLRIVCHKNEGSYFNRTGENVTNVVGCNLTKRRKFDNRRTKQNKRGPHREGRGGRAGVRLRGRRRPAGRLGGALHLKKCIGMISKKMVFTTNLGQGIETQLKIKHSDEWGSLKILN